MSDVELWVWEAFIAEDGHPATRPRPPTDAKILAAAANLDGAKIVDTGWRPLKTYGDGPAVFFAPGRYLVIPLPDKESP